MNIDCDPPVNLIAADYAHQSSWTAQQTADLSRRFLQELASDSNILTASDEEVEERDNVESNSNGGSEGASESRVYNSPILDSDSMLISEQRLALELLDLTLSWGPLT
jgi:hypothetical protein